MGQLLSDFGLWLKDLLVGLINYIFILVADLLGFILGLLPELDSNLQPLSSYIGAFGQESINFLIYMEIPQMFAIVISALTIRGILMIFGR